jgi:hypothetical protein
MAYSVQYGTTATVSAARGLSASAAQKKAEALRADGLPNVRIWAIPGRSRS